MDEPTPAGPPGPAAAVCLRVRCLPPCVLTCKDHGLAQFPTDVDADQVVSLDLQSNALTEIPAAAGLLTRLRTLDVSHNRIERIASELAMCTSLLELDLSGSDYRLP